MAVVRARTSPPYALILFVVLWVISTGIAVFLYTQQAEIKKQADAAKADREKYVSQLDKTSGDPYIKTTVTAISVLQNSRRDLISAIGAGSGTSGGDDLAAGNKAIAEASNALKVASDKDVLATRPASLTKAITDLTDKVKKLNIEVAAQTEAAAKAEAKATASNSELQATKAAHAVTLKERNDTIAELGRAKQELADKIPEITKVEEQKLTDANAKNDTQVRQLGLQINELQGNLKASQEKILLLQDEIRAGRASISSTVSDVASGKIVRTNIAAGEVTIALGVADHVVRGLTFSVFDQRTGVKVDKDDNSAKAAIEIVEVGEKESRCRVIHLERNMRVEQGDLIYNLVYSQQKNRKYRFAVFGDFDLDGDGNSTSTERDRIVSMIKSWGGIVDEIPVVELRDKNGQIIMGEDGKPKKAQQVLPETDFLVLGTQPVDPKASKDLDLVSEQQIEKMKSDYESFKVVQGSARASGVTVLNTNRFLYLIGYYNTTLVRY